MYCGAECEAADLDSHQELCLLFKEGPGKYNDKVGLARTSRGDMGVFAIEEVSIGEVLCTENPFYKFHRHEGRWSDDDFRTILKDDRTRGRLFQLSPVRDHIADNDIQYVGSVEVMPGVQAPVFENGDEHLMDLIVKTAMDNAFHDDIFFMMSFFNHHCLPNCAHLGHKGKAYIKSFIDIPAGEELTLLYTDTKDLPFCDGPICGGGLSHIVHRAHFLARPESYVEPLLQQIVMIIEKEPRMMARLLLPNKLPFFLKIVEMIAKGPVKPPVSGEYKLVTTYTKVVLQ